MKIFRAVMFAGALYISTISLSGCINPARSQPTQSSQIPDYWSEKVGQKCAILFSNQAGSNMSISGVLKSATKSWVVVGEVLETDSINGKDVGMIRDYYVPTQSISYVSFVKPQNSK